MLRHEYGMLLHRRLLAIIFIRERRCQSGRDEINGVGPDGVDALGLDVLEVLFCQSEPRSAAIIV